MEEKEEERGIGKFIHITEPPCSLNDRSVRANQKHAPGTKILQYTPTYTSREIQQSPFESFWLPEKLLRISSVSCLISFLPVFCHRQNGADAHIYPLLIN